MTDTNFRVILETIWVEFDFSESELNQHSEVPSLDRFTCCKGHRDVSSSNRDFDRQSKPWNMLLLDNNHEAYVASKIG